MPNRRRPHLSSFGLRHSDLIRISDFGFRISHFGFRIPESRLSYGLAPRPLAGVDREVAVGHLQDDQGHGGGVVLAEVAVPGAGAVLAGDQLVADAGVPG